jgi:hypothetical protein
LIEVVIDIPFRERLENPAHHSGYSSRRKKRFANSWEVEFHR